MSKHRNSADFDDDLDDLMPEDLSALDRLALAWDRPSTRWLVIGLVVAVLLAVVMALRSSPAQTATVPVVSKSGSAGPSPSSSVAAVADSPSPTPSPSFVVVDVIGPVRHPGLYTLPAGSRIADAVQAAGGVKGDRPKLNLAQILEDGQQIDVAGSQVAASPAVSGAATSSAQSDGKINLNTATASQLEELPRVGPVMANKIIEFREQHSGFRTVDQLREVSGIGDATFAQIAPHVTTS